MSEAEILQLSFDANEAVAGLFSIFFGIVSAYIAGLYFFLHKAPTTIKLIAFLLLTSGFMFIGQSMAGVEVRIIGLVEAWDSVSNPATGLEGLNNPVLPLPVKDLAKSLQIDEPVFDGTRVSIYMGWAVAMLVYLALFYATFLYRWPHRDGVRAGR